jgi:hypothetical protein
MLEKQSFLDLRLNQIQPKLQKKTKLESNWMREEVCQRDFVFGEKLDEGRLPKKNFDLGGREIKLGEKVEIFSFWFYGFGLWRKIE